MGNTSSKAGHSKSARYARLVVDNTKLKWNTPKVPCNCCGMDKDPNADLNSQCDCSRGKCPARWLHESTNLRSASRRKGPKCGRCVKHCLAHEGLQFQLASTRERTAVSSKMDEYVHVVVPSLTAADLFLFVDFVSKAEAAEKEKKNKGNQVGFETAAGVEVSS